MALELLLLAHAYEEEIHGKPDSSPKERRRRNKHSPRITKAIMADLGLYKYTKPQNAIKLVQWVCSQSHPKVSLKDVSL